MRRIIPIVLILVLLVSALTSCGQPKASDAAGNAAGQTQSTDSGAQPEATAKDSGDSSQGSDQSAAIDPGSIYKEKGSELSDYLSALTNGESAFDEPMSQLSDNMTALNAQMDRVMGALSLLNMPQYDILSIDDLDREEGTLMLSGNKGVRERKGNEIRFNSEQVYAEDQMTSKKGDKYSEQGVLNTKDNTLVYESKVERDGNIINRVVIEAAILKDGTTLSQFLSVSQPMTEGEPLNTTAAFKRYNQKEYSAVTADFDPKVDFKYDSIIGKGDIQTDAMAANYKVNGRFTVKDGTATFAEK